MAVTVIPAPDYSGATAGWEILARSVRENAAVERQKQSNYQELLLKLSNPETTEDEQNALLTQDPKMFLKTYGVPITSVGKDVAQFRTVAADAAAPSGMAMNRTEPTGESKRLLVPRPGGTLKQQKERADLASTQASTGRDIASTEATRAAIPIAQSDSQQRIASAVTDIKKGTRTPEGKVPTFNQAMEYIKGNYDLTPTTAVGAKMESIREILGVDLATPEGRVMAHDFSNTQKASDVDLEKAAADVRNVNAEAALREQAFDAYASGINPKTGKPLDPGVDPKELVQLGEGFSKALNSALGPLGFPQQATTKPAAWYAFDWFGVHARDNSKLLPAIFGNGVADPVQVRADLLAAAPEGRKIKTIDFPSFDNKTNRPMTVKLSVDEAVPLVTQMRRSLTTSLPPVFAAMRQASPQTLIYMTEGNPLIEQAARAYAPDLAAALDKARASQRATAAPTASGAPEDPNLSPLLKDIGSMRGEIDEIKQLLQGKAAPPPAAQ